MFLEYVVLHLFCIYSLCYYFAREIVIIIIIITLKGMLVWFTKYTVKKNQDFFRGAVIFKEYIFSPKYILY